MPACSLNPLIGSREELDIVIVVAAGNRSFGLDGTTEDGLHALDDYPNYLHDEDARLASLLLPPMLLLSAALHFLMRQ